MASSRKDLKSYSKLAQLYHCYQPDYPIYELINKVLKKEGDLNYKIPANSRVCLSEPNLSGGTALHLAVLRNDTITVDNLLEIGADITIQNQHGRTVVHCLFDHQNEAMKNDLLNIALVTHVSLGDPSNPCDVDGISHLHIACMKNQVNVVEFFFNCGIPIEGRVNPNAKRFAGYTPLHFAAEGRALLVIQFLLKSGANMNVKNARGLTPFHLLLNEKINVIDSLYKEYSREVANNSIVDIDAMLSLLLETAETDELGLTHFHIACAMQDTSVAEFYLAQPKIQNSIVKQVKMDSPFFSGYTALHFAARCNLNTAKRLLAKQANFEVRDANGVTPMDLFWRKESREELQAILYQNWKYAKFSEGPVLMDFVNCMWDNDALRGYLDRNELSLKIGEQPPCWTDRTLMHFAVLLCKDISTMRIFMEPAHQFELRSQISAQDFYGSTPIHLAFRANKLEIVDLLMHYLDNPIKNLVDKDGLSFLHIACAIKKPHFVENFCQSGENIRSICRGTYSHPLVKPGSTALHVAVASGDPRSISILLRRGLNPLTNDANGETSLDRFLRLTHPAEGVCQAFLESDKVTKEVLEYIGLTRLHLAAYSNVAEIRTFKNREALITAIVCNDPASFLYEYNGDTPLHMALKRHATVEHAQLLLGSKTNLLARNTRGECPLYTALSLYVRDDGKTAPDILDWIIGKLQYSADLRRQLQEMSGITILHLVCYNVDVNAISWLMIGNVDVDARIKSDCPVWSGCTPIHMLMKAIKFLGVTENVLKATNMLLEKGADVSVLNEDGETPIHLASQSFNEKPMFKLMTLLLDKLQVFDINPSGANGISHFHAACLVNNATVVKEFIGQGVDVNEPIDFFAEQFPGQTPLHLVMENKSSDNFNIENEEEVLDWLLMYGADVTAEDNCGQTPFLKAVRMRRDFGYWDKFVGHSETTINIRNIYEQSPLELLLRSPIIALEQISYFASHGCCLNDCNPLTEEGYLSLMMSNNHYSDSEEIPTIHKQCFDMMINHTDLNFVGKTGRGLIHNMVTTNNPNPDIFNFEDLNTKLSSMGIDVDLQDRKGKTALHLAAKFGNVLAVKELLKAGADINIVDSEGKTALGYAIEYHERIKYCPGRKCHRDIMKCLAAHVRILESLHLVVSLKNTQEKSNVMQTMEGQEKFLWEYHNNIDIDRLRKQVWVEEIDNTELRVGDFLSEKGKGIITYPFMTDILRDKVDNFFQHYDEDLKDVCMMQYGRALNRIKITTKAIDTMWAMAKTTVPHVCMEMIFQYLTNTDLLNFLEGTRAIVERMKRR